MWLQLQSQILELRLRKLRLQFCRRKLLRLRHPQPFEKVVHQRDNRITYQIIRELHGIAEAHNSVVVPPETNPRSQNPAAESHQTRVQKRKPHGRGQMERYLARPTFNGE